MEARRISKARLVVVCLSLVAVIGAMALLSQAGMIVPDTAPAITGEAASYPVSADGYTHGSNIGRTASGTSVSTADAFMTALNGNQSINLQSDITLSNTQAFSHSGTYSATIYGNGHTVTLTGKQSTTSGITGNIANGSNIGGLVSTLTGKIYDLNVELKSGTSASYINVSGGKSMRLGLIAGVITDGGTVENCTVTIPSGSVLAALSATGADESDGANTGAIAGNCNGSMTIKNVTVTNNGKIIGALGTSFTSLAYRLGSGTAAMFVAFIWNDRTSYTQTMDNLVAKGNGTIEGWCCSALGMTYASAKAITITNYYNQFTGTYSYGSTSGGIFGTGSTPLVSYTLFKWKGSGDSSKIVNYYNGPNTDETKMVTGFYAVPDASVEVNTSEYTVGFDPKASKVASSLVVVKSGVVGGERYVATIANVKSTPYVYTNNYAFSADGGTVIFRNLSTTASDWRNSNGNFACTINITKKTVDVTPVADVNKWESSYCTTPVETGAVANNGEELERMIAQNVPEIYLADDITDFVGFNTATYSGTIYGNGHTVYIVDGNANTTETVGGLFGTLTGTIENVRIVLYTSYTRSVTSNKLATGLIAGSIAGGTVDNVYVYIPDGVTFGVTGGGYEGYVGAVAGVADGTSYTIKNTTVDIDGKMHLDGTYVYMAGFVGKSATGSSAVTATLTNNVFKGNGNFSSASSNGTEPIYLAATTVLFQAEINNPESTINIDGFINAFKGGTTNLTGGYSMYGVLTKNDNGKTMKKWTNNVSNVYDYDSPWADINNKGTDATGNNYIDVSKKRATVSTTVESSTIKVMPYFPASDTEGKLYLVAGDGKATVPDLEYNDCPSKADGNYKVVTILKSKITAKSTVTLTEVITPATPIDDLNQWEHGYVSGTGSSGTAVSDGTELANAINDGGDIYLTGDIRDFVGFSHTKTYSGTLDGNGHTIYIVKARAASGNNIGGLFSTLSGTIENVRIVVMAGVDLPSTGYVGAVAGALSGDAEVNNVSVIINSGVSLISTISGNNAGGAGGIAGGLISGAGTVTISNSTVELNGELNATAKWTFIGGFVGHLNGGNINFTDVIFKGTGALNGTATGGEGVHTAAVAVVGGGVKAVTLDGLINAFTGTKTSNKSAYAITFVRNGSNVATPKISHVYTYGGNFSNEGSMAFGTPVDVSKIKAEIKTVVDGETVPVIPYFPVSAGTGNLVLVAGDGQTVAGILMYGNIVSTADEANGKYSVIAVAKDDVSPKATVILTRPKVADPTLTDDSQSLVYNGAGQTVTVNELTAGDGTITLTEDQYTLTFAAASEGALLDGEGKPLNAGTYTLTVTLKGYFFVSGGNTYDLKVIVGQLSVNVEIDEQSKLYGEADPVLTFTVTGSLAQGDDDGVLGVTLTRAAGVTVGSYAITGESDSVNYRVTFTNDGGEALFTINKRPILITPDEGQGHIYGESDTGDLEYEVSGGAGTTGSALIGSDVLSGKSSEERRVQTHVVTR